MSKLSNNCMWKTKIEIEPVDPGTKTNTQQRPRLGEPIDPETKTHTGPSPVPDQMSLRWGETAITSTMSSWKQNLKKKKKGEHTDGFSLLLRPDKEEE